MDCTAGVGGKLGDHFFRVLKVGYGSKEVFLNFSVLFRFSQVVGKPFDFLAGKSWDKKSVSQFSNLFCYIQNSLYQVSFFTFPSNFVAKCTC